MADMDKKERRYHIEAVETTPSDAEPSPDTLPEDPLDNLPDLTSQTAGLPIVTFVLLCLSGFCVILLRRAAASGQLLVWIWCIAAVAIALFGIVALIRGLFQKLRKQEVASVWYPISAAVMTGALVLGIVIGMCAGSLQ